MTGTPQPLTAIQLAVLPIMRRDDLYDATPRIPASVPRATEIHGEYQTVVTRLNDTEWAIEVYDRATAHRLAIDTANTWPGVEATIWTMVIVQRHRRLGLCEWNPTALHPCYDPAVPGRRHCVEHAHTLNPYREGAA